MMMMMIPPCSHTIGTATAEEVAEQPDALDSIHGLSASTIFFWVQMEYMGICAHLRTAST